MNSKRLITIAAMVGALALMLIIYQQQSSAQAPDFSHVIAIDGGQGSVRFFDTQSGYLYTYDRTLQEVTRIVQLTELGSPARVVLDSAQEGDDRYVNPRENLR